MVARFTKDKYGWRCTQIWGDEMNDAVLTTGVALYVNVTRAPRLGFCRRPHHYI